MGTWKTCGPSVAAVMRTGSVLTHISSRPEAHKRWMRWRIIAAPASETLIVYYTHKLQGIKRNPLAAGGTAAGRMSLSRWCSDHSPEELVEYGGSLYSIRHCRWACFRTFWLKGLEDVICGGATSQSSRPRPSLSVAMFAEQPVLLRPQSLLTQTTIKWLKEQLGGSKLYSSVQLSTASCGYKLVSSAFRIQFLKWLLQILLFILTCLVSGGLCLYC